MSGKRYITRDVEDIEHGMVMGVERVPHSFRGLLSHTVNAGVGFLKHYVHHREFVLILYIYMSPGARSNVNNRKCFFVRGKIGGPFFL